MFVDYIEFAGARVAELNQAIEEHALRVRAKRAQKAKAAEAPLKRRPAELRHAARNTA